VRAAWRAVIRRWPVHLSEVRATLDAFPRSITDSITDSISVDTAW
jgi:hypothetical protein